ncbi:MAG: hypothetical protein JWN99_2042, partial [Ilumatobacteraceae bacterium]|nr:hypothetical protein [Ilumatobacteraceae bacterium]
MSSGDLSSLSKPFDAAIARVEHESRLDTLVDRLRPVAEKLNVGTVGSLLRGDWLGHPLHPLMTDIVIGSWTSSFMLDLVGGRRSRAASQRLIAIGLLSLAPTAAAGAADWNAIDEQPSRRVGVVHAAGNTVAGGLYLLSWRARRRGNHATGVAFGMAGATVASIAG